MNTIQGEFKPIQDELQKKATRLDTLRKEIQTMQTEAQKPNSPISPQSIQVKVDEHDKLQREAKFQQDDANARYQTRYNTIVGPVMQDILRAMQDFAKQKGYSMIFDAAKLDESGLVLAVGDVASIDVTKDFVAFFNARPATTAVTTPTTPKQ